MNIRQAVPIATVYLIGCSKAKLAGRHPAEALYVSERFLAARALVIAERANWAILSGKHGLVAPDDIIENYETDLSAQPAATQGKWSVKVIAEIRKRYPRPCRIVVLADEPYFAGWLGPVQELGYQVSIPTHRIEGAAINWLYASIRSHPKRMMLDSIYDMLQPLVEKANEFRRFADCRGASGWPAAGVYLFFDTKEARLFSPRQPKVVRIGTHGVSDGSASTLWQRMKAHKGDMGGWGNHRTSIFRLHVGTALMKRNGWICPSWGSTSKPSPEELKKESEIEREVSAYISELHVSVLPITDKASKRSDRAYVEQNLIAIMSGLPGPVESASEGWLGFQCSNPAVRRSSLWNVNHTEEQFDPNFLHVLGQYLDVAIGLRPAPAESIAPKNWYELSQEGFVQTRLFEDH